MELAARLDDYGKPAWIALMVLGFVIFWPVGLALLAYLIWSGSLGCCGRSGPGRWHNGGSERGRFRDDWWTGGRRRASSSGNSAFDEYRDETMRRLEEEQREFKAFLERLRHAKDKTEFDQYMAERRRQATDPGATNGPEGPAAPPQA